MVARIGHTMNKQNSHAKPNRRNQVNRQLRIQETRTEIFSSHVGQATDVHEQVTNDNAHPLVFADKRGKFNVNPAGLPIGFMVRNAGVLHNGAAATIAKRVLRLRRTQEPRARLRMIEYRGVVTGTMSYDALPINDHFRKIDDNTLLGVMDLRGATAPFVFLLRRTGSAGESA